MHGHFDMGYYFAPNQHFKSTLLGGGGGGHKKEYAVYACENDDNSGRPLSIQQILIKFTALVSCMKILQIAKFDLICIRDAMVTDESLLFVNGFSIKHIPINLLALQSLFYHTCQLGWLIYTTQCSAQVFKRAGCHLKRAL